jgi:hypothetical protein
MIIPADEDLIIEEVEKVGKSVVNIAGVRMVQDQLFRFRDYNRQQRIHTNQ